MEYEEVNLKGSVEELMKDEKIDIEDPVKESNLIAIAFAVLAILITIVFLLYRSLKSRADTILLIGLSDSGKTRIFAKIANKNNEPVTYTSFQENIMDIDVKGAQLKLVDFPGAERLRKQLVEKWLKKGRSSLRGIVFVVDSSTFSKRSRDVAEFLYDVILESGKKIPVVVVCNKQDHELSKSSQVIRASLEKEIGLINRTRAAALSSTDGSSVSRTLTNTGDKFTWSDLPTVVDFIECCAVNGTSVGLEALRSWIEQ
ncbi:hypothetical protein KIN20_014957 [Parelaphostrongylus tenuis]|uniref:Signal recognition particle receptor subunit beta n=1 Tax=Parelaphostrongylus tenuis TaxID=148309 RepID=A0AAD5MXV9_PARTN|nr:hypothetical protein KIN20_014957 [Parelaphostrongylus tenuis]